MKLSRFLLPPHGPWFLRRVHTWLFIAVAIAWLCGSTSQALGQVDELPLYEREPFDRITLNAANDSTVLEVFPVDAWATALPASFQGQKFTIRRIDDPVDVRFSLSGQAIVKVQRFPDLLSAAAQEAISTNDLDRAFRLLARLRQDYPDTPELTKTEEEFFFADTRELFRKRKFDEALISLDEVFQRNPRRQNLGRALNGILSQVLQTEFANEEFASVRDKLDFAKRKYGTIAGPLVARWEQRLQRRAQAEFGTAQSAYQTGDASAALIALRKATEVWPGLSGIGELKDTIIREFPSIRVGVSQAYHARDNRHSAVDLLDWPTRRVGPLLRQRLLLLKRFTVDGGEFASNLGTLTIATDRQQIDLQLHPRWVPAGHRLAHQLKLLADPQQPHHSPRWSEYVEQFYWDGETIQIRLTRPTLRPEGLLPKVLRDPAVDDLMEGDFREQSTASDEVTSYLRRVKRVNSDLSELTETLFDDASQAAAALTDGRVDVIDRVYPGDVPRLAGDRSVELIRYRLPTIHGLVLNDREPLLRQSAFRRGLLYGIDRQTFVRQELGSPGSEHARVLSGFAPLGTTADDPLGYAYDTTIRPRKYDPSLALVLLRLAMRTRTDQQRPTETSSSPPPSTESSSSDGPTSDTEAPPENSLPELTLAYPNSHIALASSEWIASHWRKLGIQIRLRRLAPGEVIPPDGDWDVLYLEATMEEPLVDLPELILGHRILGRHGGLVWHAMRQLQEAQSFDDVREEFGRIHRLTFDHTPMLPLWQVNEHAAIRQGFQGVGREPIFLYQNLEQWKLAP